LTKALDRALLDPAARDLSNTTGPRAKQAPGFAGDVNTLQENGLWNATDAATNTPSAGYWLIRVMVDAGATYITQYAIAYGGDGAADSLIWKRDKNGAAAWTAWIRVLETQAEMDARYAKIAAVNSFRNTQTFFMPDASATDPIDEIKEFNTGAFTNIEVRGVNVGGVIGPAAILFHRPGAYATYFGLDKDNKFRYGGFSAGANSYEIFSETSGQFVSNARMTNMASGTFKARKSATAGPPEDININDLRNLTGQGDIYLSSVVIPNGSSFVDVTLPAGYDWFEVEVPWACPNANNSALYARLFNGAGAELVAGYYEVVDYSPNINTVGRVHRQGTNAQWQLTGSVQNTSHTAAKVKATLDPGGPARYPHLMWESVHYQSSVDYPERFNAGGFVTSSSRASKARFYFGGGTTFLGGQIILRGFKIP
jgi:hypothetical protein